MEEIEIPKKSHVRERIYDSIMNLSLFNGLKSDDLHIVANHMKLVTIEKGEMSVIDNTPRSATAMVTVKRLSLN